MRLGAPVFIETTDPDLLVREAPAVGVNGGVLSGVGGCGAAERYAAGVCGGGYCAGGSGGVMVSIFWILMPRNG